jgi:hypothetical protein
MATGLQRDLLDRFRLQMAETARGERFLALSDVTVIPVVYNYR